MLVYVLYLSVKETVQREFWPPFFMTTYHPSCTLLWLLFHLLKYFAYSFDFAKRYSDVQKNRLWGVIDTTESDSAISMTPRSQTQRCQWHHGVRLSVVNDTTESYSALSMTPRSQTQRCQWHHGVRLSIVNDTTESDSALSMTPWSQTQRCQWHRGVRLSVVKDTMESDSALLLTPQSQT